VIEKNEIDIHVQHENYSKDHPFASMLIEQYNSLHTCYEEQKQFLLLAVAEH